MELWDRDGDLFAKIAKARNGYPVKLSVILLKAGFAAWMTEGEDTTHEELVERPGKAEMAATAKDASGMRTLVAWHRWLDHRSFKTVVALAENGADGMVITDLPKKIPSLDVLQRNRYTSRTRRGEIMQESTWIESTSR